MDSYFVYHVKFYVTRHYVTNVFFLYLPQNYFCKWLGSLQIFYQQQIPIRKFP